MLLNELGLSVGTRNALLRGRINTVEELIVHNEKELLEIRGLGKEKIIEIKKALNQIGKGLRTSKYSYDEQIEDIEMHIRAHELEIEKKKEHIKELKKKIKELEKKKKGL